MSEPIFYQCTVIDNNDPLMLGRVRAKINILNYPDIIRSIENWNPINDPWTERDPLVFNPLLPYFLYQVPEVNEMIQVIFTNKDFKYQNQYYIQSNFFSPGSVFNTNNNGGAKFTGTGMQFKPPRQIKNKDGSWPNNSVEKGIYPEPGDNGILGRGSSDVIVKKDEILMRAGKFSQSPQSNITTTPNLNRSFLQLSIFDKTKTGTQSFQQIETKPITLLVNYLIEWTIINPENNVNPRAFTGAVYLYSLKPSQAYNTENLKVSSEIPERDKFLIYSEDFTGLDTDRTIEFINSFIRTCNSANVSRNGNTLFSVSLYKFPIFFRPTLDTLRKLDPDNNSTPTVKNNLQNVYNGIKLNTSDRPGFGLIWKQNTTGVPTKTEIQSVTSDNFVSVPYTVAALGGQKIYLLSQDSKIPGKAQINFADSIYGIPGTKFDDNILPNTSSMVRGEELLELINLIYQFLISHTHAYPGLTPVKKTQSGVTIESLNSLMQNAKNQILNTNIRLN